MLTIAYYFLQVIFCSALLMGYYLLVLRNKRFHQYNRFYLLTAAILSCVVPLIKITWPHSAAVQQQPQVIRLLTVVAQNNSQIEAKFVQPGFQWSWNMAGMWLYILVSVILLSGMIMALYRIYRLLKQHSCKNVEDVYLIFTNAKGTPFSFFRYIFWNEEIDIRSESGKQILQHELTHVRQKHSFDKIFIQSLLVVAWFNPFFWLLKREMDMIHEFIADKKAVRNGDTAMLAQMLLTTAFPQQQFRLANPFFFSPIKRRLLMLTNTANPRFSYIRRLIVLPMLAIVVVLFSFRGKQHENTPLSVESVVKVMVNAVTGKNDIKKEEAVPGILSLSKDQQDKRMEWDTMIQPQMATRAKAELVFTRPVDLTMQIVHLAPDKIAMNAGLKEFLDKAPLYVIDGVRKGRYANLNDLDPVNIERVDVSKGASATDRFGSDAINGVVEITTKTPSYDINNGAPYYISKGKSYVRTKNGDVAWTNDITDIILVNGMRMTPGQLNEKFKPEDFATAASDESIEAIEKYGKPVLVLSSGKLNSVTVLNLTRSKAATPGNEIVVKGYKIVPRNTAPGYYFFCLSKPKSPIAATEKQMVYYTEISKIAYSEEEVSKQLHAWSETAFGRCASKNGCTADVKFYSTFAEAQTAFKAMQLEYSDRALYERELVLAAPWSNTNQVQLIKGERL